MPQKKGILYTRLIPIGLYWVVELLHPRSYLLFFKDCSLGLGGEILLLPLLAFVE